MFDWVYWGSTFFILNMILIEFLSIISLKYTFLCGDSYMGRLYQCFYSCHKKIKIKKSPSKEIVPLIDLLRLGIMEWRAAVNFWLEVGPGFTLSSSICGWTVIELISDNLVFLEIVVKLNWFSLGNSWWCVWLVLVCNWSWGYCWNAS